MKTRTVNLSLPTELLDEIDKQAKDDYSSRSDFVRKALVNQLRTERNLEDIFDRANAKGRAMSIKSEQQVYDIIDGE